MKSIKYTGYRRTISAYTKLASALPTVHETTEINITGVREFCRENDVTLTAVIIKVLASVQEKHPLINSFIARNVFLRKTIYLPDAVDMAVAIEMHEFDSHFSAMTVLRDIRHKTIQELGREIDGLRQLTYAQLPLSGLMALLDRLPDFMKSIGLGIVSQIPALRQRIFGTMGFSSLGKYGLKSFDTLFYLNIGYGIGGIEERVILEGDSAQTIPILTLTQTSDHRIVDGAEAARILAEIKRIFESGEYKTILKV